MDIDTLRRLARTLQGWRADHPDHEMLFQRPSRLDAESIELPDLVLARSFHDIALDDAHFPVEVVQRRPVAQWFAERGTYIALGIVLIDFVLSDLPSLTVVLSHDKSRVERLYFCKSLAAEGSPFLSHEPIRFTSYCYIPDRLDANRFVCADPALASMAAGAALATHFTWSDPSQRHAQSLPPDGLLVNAVPARLAKLGQLLIDFGRDENTVCEFALESTLDGCGGIAHGSVELRLNLPGSLGFPGSALAEVWLPPE